MCILVLAIMFLVVAPAALVFYKTQDWTFFGGTVALCAGIFIFPLDLWLDDKWRRSAKL